MLCPQHRWPIVAVDGWPGNDNDGPAMWFWLIFRGGHEGVGEAAGSRAAWPSRGPAAAASRAILLARSQATGSASGMSLRSRRMRTTPKGVKRGARFMIAESFRVTESFP